jgi:hypothetical protein
MVSSAFCFHFLYSGMVTSTLPSPTPELATPAAWVVSADMGFGHRRAVYPLAACAHEEILVAGAHDSTSPGERKLWKRLLGIYETFSRARSLPIVGRPVFSLLDTFLRIPSYYPMRNLSNSTFQVALLERLISQGLCAGLMEKLQSRRLPLVTSFFAPAIAADRAGYESVFCIICDADLNRVWVAKEPWESRITYFAPCGKAAQRLKAYGVPEEKILLTGFPLAHELLGGRDLPILKHDLFHRLRRLDPRGRFWQRHGASVEQFLGNSGDFPPKRGPLTITYTVGGAGAQREIGAAIARSLSRRILNGEVRLNLFAGIKPDVRDTFIEVKNTVARDSSNLTVLYAESPDEYFRLFDKALRTTDVLWSKPSELSFYCALGLPIVMTPAIGSQEQFNRRWLIEIGAGVRQENPEYADQWLLDLLQKGHLADAAWSGFLKARKLGLYNILDILTHGSMPRETSAIFR